MPTGQAEPLSERDLRVVLVELLSDAVALRAGAAVDGADAMLDAFAARGLVVARMVDEGRDEHPAGRGRRHPTRPIFDALASDPLLHSAEHDALVVLSDAVMGALIRAEWIDEEVVRDMEAIPHGPSSPMTGAT